jgi:SAM-dependent methyltransferase
VKECSKSIFRRLSDSNFIRKYFVGSGIDIGGKPDPLCFYREFFPLITSVKTWDWEDGDAQNLESVCDEQFDFVHSSHCLEHLSDPVKGLKNWFRVLKPGGYLIVTVPDEDMYEQGVFPSNFNLDHKWTFTLFKHKSWSPNSINIMDILKAFELPVEVIKLEKLTSTYQYGLPRFDQTLTSVSECGIEFIVRKVASENPPKNDSHALKKVDKEILVYLNQYMDDMTAMKIRNRTIPPFKNDAEVN